MKNPIEYGLIAALIAVAIIAVVQGLNPTPRVLESRIPIQCRVLARDLGQVEVRKEAHKLPSGDWCID